MKFLVTLLCPPSVIFGINLSQSVSNCQGYMNNLHPNMITIRKVEPEDQKRIIDLLLTDFFPYEPCAVGLDLCPLGYRIPALEQDINNILSKGWSFLAEEMVTYL